MAWKERHVARLGPVLRAVGLLVSVFAVVFLGDMLLELGRPAFAELGKYGYGDAAYLVVHKARDELQGTLAFAASAASAVWIVGLAGTAAAGIPSEREDDTWISLLGTSLTGGEILRGKALGALHRWRAAGLAAVGLWTFGLVAGAIHPLAFALTLVLFAVYSAFALALGSFLGLRARSTTRAMVATMSVLFVLNGGYLMCVVPLVDRAGEVWVTAPIMPYVVALSAERYAPVQALFGMYPVDNINMRLDTIVGLVLTCGVSLVGYGVAAVVLGVAAIDGFDRAADRPRRPPGSLAALDEKLAAVVASRAGGGRTGRCRDLTHAEERPMPFGPIIDAELTRLARQRRWYVLRVALGLGLLALLYEVQRETLWISAAGPGWSDDWRLQYVASAILRASLIGQTVAIFFLAPMLVAGAIAEEKQRKTLHYLLASRLSSFEIVAGKLVARLLLVAMPVLMVAPVAITAAIFGRIPVAMVLMIYGATFTTVVFEAALAILVSTLARRGREAILFMFLLGLAWFVGPILLQNVLTGLREPWPTLYYRWIEPINAPLIELSPLVLVMRPLAGRAGDPLPGRVQSMMVHQAIRIGKARCWPWRRGPSGPPSAAGTARRSDVPRGPASAGSWPADGGLEPAGSATTRCSGRRPTAPPARGSSP